MKTGDLVKYKKCGTLGIITKIRELDAKFNSRVSYIYEVLWSDGLTTDQESYKLEAVCK